ncbi:hypothetical protein OAB00_01245 [Akkermansiaceae bacterium]|nr:hypothetical protein [Akkermansiaceae bacterium]
MNNSFSINIAKWVKDSSDDIETLQKAIILELFTSVILDTPVGTSDPSRSYVGGRLRGNWIISSDEPANGTFDVIDPDGTKTTKKVEDFVSKIDFKKDVSLFLTNNLPYAYRIEYDGWSHTKAPEGMVRKNFIRITNNLR